MKIQRLFTDEVEYFKPELVKRHAKVGGFEQKDVLFPESWSQNAVNIVASRYFKGKQGDLDREFSLGQVLNRVVGTIKQWALSGMYFDDIGDADIFADELYYILYNQMAAFNSPVWFNLGTCQEPQVSACFINSVEDNMESILDLAKTEGILFRNGSGTGTNFSSLRSSHEGLSGGGMSSGPLEFMKGFDSFAGAIKSGGKTRRSAKMVILNIDHPDVPEFIRCKAEEEKKAWALIDAGYSGEFDGDAYRSIFFQNSNNSVRVPDEFMIAVEDNTAWNTVYQNGELHKTHNAVKLLAMIAEAAYVCGDPGIQYHDTINSWHTCPESGPINSSNPCSEFMFLDDTACNLASINLLKFLSTEKEHFATGFNIETFVHTCRVMIAAQEIMVSNASYPTDRITRNSEAFRPLGLGFANLGAFLMAKGIAYDSDEGREWAAAITSLMTGSAYGMSAEIAKLTGAFDGYHKNKESMLNVIYRHREHGFGFSENPLYPAVEAVWDRTIEVGSVHGFRNSQVTVIAPTGTISFMMDCDTTGIEPELALVKHKRLDGGGTIGYVNKTVSRGLQALKYGEQEIADISQHIDNGGSIRDSPHILKRDYPVFATSFGDNTIHYSGHIKMVAAVQPFLSGAVSKTINLPNDSTVEDIEEAYILGWKLGCKSLAVYRDGCKVTQPMNAGKEVADISIPPEEESKALVALKEGRRKLPNERQSITHKFTIGGQHEGYLTVGMFPDGSPGEIFVVMSKEGSTLSGLMDAFATSVSMSLQYGVPLDSLVEKFAHSRFEPSGFTGNPDVPMAKSIVDYIFRWIGIKFGTGNVVVKPLPPQIIPPAPEEIERYGLYGEVVTTTVHEYVATGEFCPDCGGMMLRAGSCFSCPECGASSGCG